MCVGGECHTEGGGIVRVKRRQIRGSGTKSKSRGQQYKHNDHIVTNHDKSPIPPPPPQQQQPKGAILVTPVPKASSAIYAIPSLIPPFPILFTLPPHTL